MFFVVSFKAKQQSHFAAIYPKGGSHLGVSSTEAGKVCYKYFYFTLIYNTLSTARRAEASKFELPHKIIAEQ
jgi:hypothetical protein